MSSKGPESWVCDANVHSLRVEESPERILLLPYDQFVYAEFHPSGSEQRLDLMFATHEVQIHGYALRRLVVALQRRELALITPPFFLSPTRHLRRSNRYSADLGQRGEEPGSGNAGTRNNPTQVLKGTMMSVRFADFVRSKEAL